MSAVPPFTTRGQTSTPDAKGRLGFDWTLTSSSLRDTVILTAKVHVLPIIFVPGIMGSNLRSRAGTKPPVWRLDTAFGEPVGLLMKYRKADSGERQSILHPDRVEVDPDGAVPKHVNGIGDRDAVRARGWGEVAQGSYQSFLLWLDEQLNPPEPNPALWREYYQDETTISATPKPGDIPKLYPGIRMGLQGQPFGAEKEPFASIMTDDLLRRSKFAMPIHAVGYNWLDSNSNAARATLKPAIERIIKQYDGRYSSCEQVILVTHSMGGLVARACAELPGMAEKIAGVVHGVMPAAGAAVAYRRCKVGMSQEGYLAGLVLGSTGKEVTSVFAQAPGALQLLPTADYQAGWLQVMHGKAAVETQPRSNPYDDIYLCRDKWWGLINEAWLSPKNGVPIKWADFEENIAESKRFHSKLAGKFHKTTYAYYGADKQQASFEKVTWRMSAGLRPDDRPAPTAEQAAVLSPNQVRADGTSPEYVGGKTEVQTNWSPMGGGSVTIYDSSYWELHCEMQDGVGDGTVPQSSGAAPLKASQANVHQQFRLSGFDHEKSYRNAAARAATLYSINKLAGIAKISE